MGGVGRGGGGWGVGWQDLEGGACSHNLDTFRGLGGYSRQRSAFVLCPPRIRVKSTVAGCWSANITVGLCCVRQHPFTGRTTLWTSPFFLEECRDMGLEQAKIQLEEILLPGLSGDAVYKHDWRIGDLVLFDNRSMMHSTTKLVDAPQLMYQVFLRTKAQMKSAKQTQP